MRVLVTGHNGYIGCVLVPLLQRAGHDVVGLDSYLYESCTFGLDAVVHLAAISNDPVGDLNAETTYDINHRGASRLARLAKQAGVTRFLFSSSCSLYGAAGNDFLDESADFNPVTPYGESKLLVENDLRE